MKVSLEKKYRTRDGRKVELLGINDKLTHAVFGIVFSKGRSGLFQWPLNGRGSYIDKKDDSDLIEVKRTRKRKK